MSRGSASLGLVAVGSLLVGCSEHQPMAPAVLADAARDAGPIAAMSVCTHVAGALVFSSFTFTSPTTAHGEGTVHGDLSGTFVADYFDIQQRGGGVIQMHAHHTITRSSGTIITSDDILLLPDRDPTVALPNSRLHVTAGTGAYAGATGLLHTHGDVNLVTLDGSIDYKGQVCVP